MKISLAISALDSAKPIKVPKQPTVAWLKANAKKVNGACKYAELWYGSPTPNQKTKLEPSIAIFVKMFGYVPYTGKLYRMQTMNDAFGEKAVEGKKYPIQNKPFKELQSWTTDPGIARAFHDNIYQYSGHENDGNTVHCVFQLVSPAEQLMNSRWLWSCAYYLDRINKNAGGIINIEYVEGLLTTAKSYAITEDEVILKLGKSNTMKLIEIINFNKEDEDGYITTVKGWLALLNYVELSHADKKKIKFTPEINRTLEVLEVHQFGDGDTIKSVERAMKENAGTKDCIQLQAIFKQRKWDAKKFCDYVWAKF